MPAADVSQTSAKIKADVTWSQGESGSYWFEYRTAGPGQPPWTQTQHNNWGPMGANGAGTLQETLTGLTPATTYQYRLCGTLLVNGNQTPGCFDSQGGSGTNYSAFTTAPAAGAWPNRANTGTPAGWTPTTTRSTTLTVTQPGTVVEDIRFTNGASIDVNAANVTIRRVELQGGSIDTACNGNTVIEDTSILPRAGQDYGNDVEGVVGYGGYTARRVEIYHRSEGFRASGCGPVRVEDTWAQITPPQPCGDWHGDGLQGYFGGPITIRNVYLELDITGCGGTAPFFVPSPARATPRSTSTGCWSRAAAIPSATAFAGTVSKLKVVEQLMGVRAGRRELRRALALGRGDRHHRRQLSADHGTEPGLSGQRDLMWPSALRSASGPPPTPGPRTRTR